MTSITLPNSVTRIGNSAFFFSGLTSVMIPGSVISIGDGAFGISLTNITVETANRFYSSTNGGLFDKGGTTLIRYSAAKSKSCTIPDSVISIGRDAFFRCTNLTSVTIGNSVTGIDDGAFYGCKGLTDITIPDSVTNIGSHAFSSCTKLTKVYFNGNAPHAGSRVFTGANDAIIYYLPETTGWGATFGDRPTALKPTR